MIFEPRLSLSHSRNPITYLILLFGDLPLSADVMYGSPLMVTDEQTLLLLSRFPNFWLRASGIFADQRRKKDRIDAKRGGRVRNEFSHRPEMCHCPGLDECWKGRESLRPDARLSVDVKRKVIQTTEIRSSLVSPSGILQRGIIRWQQHQLPSDCGVSSSKTNI